MWAKNLNKHFSKKDIHISRKNIKRCSTLAFFREIQIKLHMKCHFKSTRIVTIQKKKNTDKYVEKLELSKYCCSKSKVVSPSGKKIQLFFHIYNIELPYDPAIVFLDIHSNKRNRCSNKNLCTNVHSRPSCNSQKVEIA